MQPAGPWAHMYDTCVPVLIDTLTRLDAALLELRRFLDAPRTPEATPPRDVPAEQLARANGVELSTVLVVNAVVDAGIPGCDISGVAQRLQVAHSTASRLVDRAVTAGVIHRDRAPENARRVLLTLTRDGEELYTEALRFRITRLTRILNSWSAHDVTALADLLERFAHDTAESPTSQEAIEENP